MIIKQVYVTVLDRKTLATCTLSRAEGERVVSLETRIAGPECGAAGFVECIRVRIWTVRLEVAVKSNTRRRASCRRVVATRAAVCRICLIAIEIGNTGTLATNREPCGV